MGLHANISKDPQLARILYRRVFLFRFELQDEF